MRSLIRNVLQRIPELYKGLGDRYFINLSKKFYGESSHVTEEEIKRILTKQYPAASKINVTDVSGGCGAMFKIYVETSDFKGLPIVNQHRSVYDTLKEQIKNIHGLHLETKASI